MVSPQLSAQEDFIEPPSACSFYGDFEQSKFLKGLDTPLVSTGAFFYSCIYGVIWKTLLPVEETLILNSTGKPSKIDDHKVTRLKSRQGKLLGQLINGLIAADPVFINKNFDVVSTKLEQSALDTEKDVQRQSHVLNPKKRRFKRALSRIELITPGAGNPDQEQISADELVTISLLDRNQQLTRIVANKKAEYQQDKPSLEQCLASKVFSMQECELLEQTQAP